MTFNRSATDILLSTNLHCFHKLLCTGVWEVSHISCAPVNCIHLSPNISKLLGKQIVTLDLQKVLRWPSFAAKKLLWKCKYNLEYSPLRSSKKRGPRVEILE